MSFSLLSPRRWVICFHTMVAPTRPSWQAIPSRQKTRQRFAGPTSTCKDNRRSLATQGDSDSGDGISSRFTRMGSRGGHSFFIRGGGIDRVSAVRTMSASPGGRPGFIVRIALTRSGKTPEGQISTGPLHPLTVPYRGPLLIQLCTDPNPAEKPHRVFHLLASRTRKGRP